MNEKIKIGNKILLAVFFLLLTSISYTKDQTIKSENKQAVSSAKQKPSKNNFTPVPVSTIFALDVTTPTKIITPNGDGVNDTFTLVFDNQSGSIINQKKIFDLSGFEIADIKVIGDETAITAVLRWDGKDKNGETVKSGIYIYQVQAEGKVINGTIVVAR